MTPAILVQLSRLPLTLPLAGLLLATAPMIQGAEMSHFKIDAPDSLKGRLAVEVIGETLVQDSIRVPGRIALDEGHLAKIGPSISGRVVEIRGMVGQTVHKGQVLAILNSTELSHAQASFLKAKSQAELKRLYVTRSRHLYDEGVISLLNLKERESVLIEKEIEMKALEDELRVMGMKQDDILELGLKGHINSMTPISASIDGQIIDRHVSVGQIAEISDDLFIVANLRTVWVVAEVPEKAASALEPLARAEISIPALAHEKFEGRLDYIASTVDAESRTVMIRIELPNSELKLKPEMLANIVIHQSAVSALTVAANAVVRDSDEDYVFVEKGGQQYEFRPIRLGEELDGRRKIISGLESGERVVVQGSFVLNSIRIQQMGH